MRISTAIRSMRSETLAAMKLRLPIPLLAILAGLGLSGCGPATTSQDAAKQVIIFDIDTLRADRLGCYGAERPTSPHIDRLAAESVLFEWAFAQGPNTPPSQTSILTGLYPSHHGRVFALDVLADEVVTLAEVMRDGGFVTAAFVDGGNMAAASGLNQGFEMYRSTPGGGFEVIGPRVMRWLSRHVNDDFLLLVHTYDVHSPYDPPEPHRSMFVEDRQPTTPDFEPTTDILTDVMIRARRGEQDILSSQDIDYALARYDGGVHYVDQWMGTFLEKMRRLGIYDNSTIILLSDHGEEFQEHGSVLHEKLYTTVSRIPLIIRPPGGRKTFRVPQVVESIDLMPTILEMVGVELPPTPIDGESLLPLMTGQSQGPYFALSESRFFGGRDAIASGGRHLLRSRKTGFLELYAFTEDPTELSHLQPERRDEAMALRAQLDSRRPSGERGSVEEQITDSEIIDQLKALGYLNDE